MGSLRGRVDGHDRRGREAGRSLVARSLCRDDVRRLVPAVPGSADDRADGAAAPRRGAKRVEFGDAGVPGPAARGLCLRPLARPFPPASPSRNPSRPPGARRTDAADRPDGRQSAGRRQPVPVGPMVAVALDWPSVLCGFGPGAAASGLVRADRGGRSLSALRCLEPRQFRRNSSLIPCWSNPCFRSALNDGYGLPATVFCCCWWGGARSACRGPRTAPGSWPKPARPPVGARWLGGSCSPPFPRA